MSSWIRFMVWRRQRTSDDDIIVLVRWELGDMVIDRSVRLCDGDDEEQQRLCAQIHDSLSPQLEYQANRVRFIPTEVRLRRHWHKSSTSWCARCGAELYHRGYQGVAKNDLPSQVPTRPLGAISPACRYCIGLCAASRGARSRSARDAG